MSSRFSMPRTSYLPPSVREVAPLEPEGTDLAIWIWEENDKVYGIAFQGKSNKPLWHYRFVNVDQRSRRVNETIESRRLSLASKAARKAARKAEAKSFQHDLRVNDVLSASWGYDQTNVDFYQVVEVVGKSVKVRHIAKTVVESDDFSDRVAPVLNDFTGEELSRRPSKYGVKIDDCRRASKWDGKPKYQTGAFCGH